MAKVTIGGTEYHVPEMNFLALERSWPHVEVTISSTDPMKGPAAALAIIAAGLMEADHFDKSEFEVEESQEDPERIHKQVLHFLKKKLKATEIIKTKDCILEILSEAGIEIRDAGEVQPLEAAASPSTAIAPSTSQS